MFTSKNKMNYDSVEEAPMIGGVHNSEDAKDRRNSKKLMVTVLGLTVLLVANVAALYLNFDSTASASVVPTASVLDDEIIITTSSKSSVCTSGFQSVIGELCEDKSQEVDLPSNLIPNPCAPNCVPIGGGSGVTICLCPPPSF